MKRRHLLLGLGLLIAAMLALFGDKTPNSPISEPTKATPAKKPAMARTSSQITASAASPSNDTGAGSIEKKTSKITADQPLPRVQDRQKLIAHAEQTSTHLFDPHFWAPPPPPPPKPLPPPPPSAPPLPFTYLGKQKEGEQWQVFLARGNTTFVVKLHEVIDNQYRIEAIAPPNMTLMYLPLNQLQTLLIE